MKVTVHTDGGSRGNPGEAAIGITVEDQDGKTTLGKKIGITTNNTAEYTALREAVKIVVEKYKTCEVEVEFFLDSELVVKQLNGLYKVKDLNLQSMYKEIKEKTGNLKKVNFIHVPREQNKEADALVNAALDNKI